MRSTIALASMLLLFSACSSKPVMTPSDMAASADASVPVDMGVPQDLAGADLSGGCMLSHSRCAWFEKDDAGMASMTAGINSGYLQAIHPVWYRILQPCATDADGGLQGDCALLDGGAQGGCNQHDGGGCTGCMPGISICENSGASDPAIMAMARKAHVLVIPTVTATGQGQPQELVALNTMLSTPGNRNAHANQLALEASVRHFDGLDLDYEHLYQIPDPQNAKNMTDFMTKFAAAMNNMGLQSSTDPPWLVEKDTSLVWDYAALAKVLTTIHVQVYDYHSGAEAGPNSPLGLMRKVVDYTTDTTADGGVDSSNMCKFIMGLPNYGYDWTKAPDGGVPTDYCQGLATCPGWCDGAPEISTHMANCAEDPNHLLGPDADGAELRCKRNLNGATGPRLYFDNAASLCEKVDVVARSRPRLGGITYWLLGNEPPGFWDCVRKDGGF